MEEHLLFAQSNVANVMGVYNFTFAVPNGAIIFYSFGHIGT